MIVAEWEGFTDTLKLERVEEDGSWRLHGFHVDTTLDGIAWPEPAAVWRASWEASTKFTPPLKRIL